MSQEMPNAAETVVGESIVDTLVCVDYPSGWMNLSERWFPVVGFAGLAIMSISSPIWSGRPSSLVSWGLALGFGAFFSTLAVCTGRHVQKGKQRRIEVDFVARTVTFENFNIARAFTTGLARHPRAVFRFEEILGTERYSQSLCIVTSAGRIGLSDSATNFEPLWIALMAIAADNPSAQVPIVYTKRFAYLVGVIASMAGLALTFFIAWLIGWI